MRRPAFPSRFLLSGWILTGLLALAPDPAEAQGQRPETAAFLAPGGDESVPVYFRSLAVQTVARQLQSEGLRLTPRGRLRRKLRRAGLLDCDRTDCADEVAQVARVDFILGVAVWAVEGTATEPGSVAVSIVEQNGASYSGTSPVEAGEVEAAALRALTEAREKQSRGPGPWLVVVGTPEGAIVDIDGTPTGVVPHRGAIEPGQHEVVVRLQGHATARQTMDVALDPSGEYRWEVALPSLTEAALGGEAGGLRGMASEDALFGDDEGLDEDSAEPASTGDGDGDNDGNGSSGGGRSTLDTVGPIVLGVAGLGAIGVGLYGALAPDDCVQQSADGTRCLIREDVPDSTGIAVWSTVGGAAVVGAILWWIFADAGGDDGDDEDSSMGPDVDVLVSPVDVGVRVRF